MLASEIRKEAAMLQFERSALLNTWGKGIVHVVVDKEDISFAKKNEEMNNAMLLDGLPSLQPPADEFNVTGCGPGCKLNHADDGPCLICGESYYNHYSHHDHNTLS